MQSVTGVLCLLFSAAVVISSAAACEDIKLFLAPCTTKALGTIIERDDALDVESEFVKKDGLEELADRSLEFYDFDLETFNDEVCQGVNDLACNLLDCGCPESRRRLKQVCLPGWCSHSAPLEFVAPGDTGVSRETPEDEDVAEAVFALCVGENCKGFLLQGSDVAQIKSTMCSEPVDEVCRVGGNTLPPPPPSPPTLCARGHRFGRRRCPRRRFGREVGFRTFRRRRSFHG